MIAHNPPQRKRYFLNVTGDFYVESNCCTACMLPFPEAPDLLAFSTEEENPEGFWHCYFKKQPETPSELEQAVRAFQVAELRCFRYAGTDPAILSRLQAVGEGAQCDALIAKEMKK